MKGDTFQKMNVDFVKMHGAGNDFIFIDDLSDDIELSQSQVANLCNRHFGIGADGLMLVRPSKHPECTAYMDYFNSDGTRAEMCGNGIRCFAKYLVDRGFVSSDDKQFIADTPAGTRPITFEVDEKEKLTQATVDMGTPIFDPADVPTTLSSNAQTPDGIPYVKEASVDNPWYPFLFTCVSMGNPHAVCFIDDFEKLPSSVFTSAEKSLETFDIPTVGSFFESHAVFPEKANIEFAQVRDDGIHMRVFERGDGETLACGTGSCATDVAAYLTGRANRENDLILLGGTLHITWADDMHVLMEGPATQVYQGTIDIE